MGISTFKRVAGEACSAEVMELRISRMHRSVAKSRRTRSVVLLESAVRARVSKDEAEPGEKISAARRAKTRAAARRARDVAVTSVRREQAILTVRRAYV